MASKKYLILLFVLITTLRVVAQPVTVTKSDIKITDNGAVFYIHTVAQGQTLYSIARAYEVEQDDITKHNPTAESGLLVGQLLKIPDISKHTTQTTTKDEVKKGDNLSGSIIHKVESGETLFGIARKYSVMPQDIIGLNPNVVNFDNLFIGQEIRVPSIKKLGGGTVAQHVEKDSVFTHEVIKGESLFGIAQQYKISSDSILAWNPEIKDKALKRGQQLRIIVKVVEKRAVEVIPATPIAVTYDTVIHKILEKETIWGIAKRYNTTVDKVMEINPELKDGLKAGYYIYVPVPAAGGKKPEKVSEVIKTDTQPAKVTSGCENSRFKPKYKVALLIPLYLDEIDRIAIPKQTDDLVRKPYFKSFNFIEFYQGVLIAADSLKSKGLSLDLYVYDTANDTLEVKKLLAKPEMTYMDMIIGPFFSQEYNIVADFAAKNNIKLVSPFARNNDRLKKCGNLYQVNAGSQSKIKELALHISRTYSDPNIVFVRSNNGEDRELAKIFKSAVETHSATQNRKIKVSEAVFSDRGITGVAQYLDATKQNIIVNVIVGETMASNYVTGMAKLTKSFDITMYGMPEWREYRTFVLADLMAVKLHLFGATFVDYQNPNTLTFLRKYRDRFNTEPDDSQYGFMGYDVALYFFKALFEFGLDFENCLPQINYNPISIGFKWQQINGKGYENLYLNLYWYNDYELVPVRQAK